VVSVYCCFSYSWFGCRNIVVVYGVNGIGGSGGRSDFSIVKLCSIHRPPGPFWLLHPHFHSPEYFLQEYATR